MSAPVYRPSGVLAGTFGVGILTFLLLPSEVAHQDLAALITRDAATLDRPQKHSRASQYGASHGANLNLSPMSGYGIKPPVEFTLAGLDPNGPEITNSIRDRILREGTVLFAPEGVNPWVDRSRKGDQLTSTARKNDNVASKGNRLAVPPVQQAEADPSAATEAPAQQVAVAPATETLSSADPVAQQVAVAPAADAPAVDVPATDNPSAAPRVTVVESEQMVEAERQLALQIEQTVQTRQAEVQPPAESEPTQQAEQQLAEEATRQAKADPKPAERVAETRQTTQKRAERPGRTRQAKSTSRQAQRLARAQREEERRAERTARIQEARQKASEKLARTQEAAKATRSQEISKTARVESMAAAANVARRQDAPLQSAAQVEAPEQIAQQPAEQVAQAAAAAQPAVSEVRPQPAEEKQSNRFVVASAGDYRIGLNARKFERATAPTVSGEAESNVEAEIARGKADALRATAAFAAGVANPTQRTSQVFFSVDPMGKRVGAIEPWAPGAEPKFDDGAKDAEVKLAALPPADSVTDIPAILQEIPPEQAPIGANQSVSKDPNARGGETIAPKGEVTGPDKRPMTPAERLGLADEKSRAKSVKCLTEVIYFESRGEVVRGQMAVAQVVLNRAFSGKYPNTVCGVVYQNAHRHLACQFTFACDGIPDRVKEPDMWDRADVIANEMLDGKIWLPEVGKATHYHAHWVHPGWVREMTKLHRVGVHTFYRPRNWGDGNDAPQWGDDGETTEVAKKLVEVAKKP